MELRELERKSGYYHGYMILEDCVENGEILYDRALKKILENRFACGEGDWWEGIDLRDEPEIFVSSEGQSTAEDFRKYNPDYIFFCRNFWCTFICHIFPGYNFR